MWQLGKAGLFFWNAGISKIILKIILTFYLKGWIFNGERPPLGPLVLWWKVSLADFRGILFLKKEYLTKKINKYVLKIHLHSFLSLIYEEWDATKVKWMQGKKDQREVSVREWTGSRKNLVITLSIPSHTVWLPEYGRHDTARLTKGLLAALFKTCTRSQKKLLKSCWRRDPFHMCHYHLNSIKTYGI